ncbi:MAG: glycosyltransferase [Coriobacteriia bacterium]|nr:glycosyltransferase [Coriobacteriia bacterium]
MRTVSIIVPLYNKVDYIASCLDSLRAQTFTDFQVLVVDDGSTDGSAQIAHNYSQIDPRIFLFRQPHAGVSIARNRGLQAALHSGSEFIGFVDADDRVSANMLADLIRQMYMSPSAAAIRCGQLIHEPCGKIYSRSYMPRGSEIALSAQSDDLAQPQAITALGSELYFQMFGRVRKSLLSTGNALYRSSVLAKHNLRFEEHLHHFEDVLFNAQFFAENLPILLTAQPLYNIRVVPDSQSRSVHHVQELRTSYDILVREVKKLQLDNKIAKKMALSFWIYRCVVRATILRMKAAETLRK